MAFGDLTSKKSVVDFTQSREYGLNVLNKNFGKFTLNTTSNPIASEKSEELATNLRKEEGGVEVLS